METLLKGFISVFGKYNRFRNMHFPFPKTIVLNDFEIIIKSFGITLKTIPYSNIVAFDIANRVRHEFVLLRVREESKTQDYLIGRAAFSVREWFSKEKTSVFLNKIIDILEKKVPHQRRINFHQE